ncbi:hypothetical protein SAMN04487910_1233 [Aquimarina amphilecti]|uniref:DUF6985 domain-containing protein n=1 Tax=Aquimarina amphilecti TaxID=1038014 RepID=A0A1H7KA79_AQUAM|nr:hypothetical protein [Aquimarina amphilecti]SEK82867.1 hypothetical protein SAMN04487910_1233 [Aquimarina amphilecti]
MKLKTLGVLKQDIGNLPLEKDWITAKPIATPFFDHKEISYRLDCTEVSGMDPIRVDQVLSDFMNINESVKIEAAKRAFENWITFNDAVGYLETIETYQTASNKPAWMVSALEQMLPLLNLTESKKVWEYITPIEIVITKDRHQRDEDIYIQILCNCLWQEEHGLQFILKEGNELIRVSDQDGNLF